MIDKGFRRAMGFAFGLALMASYASAARAETYFDSIEAGGRERHFMIVRPDGAKPGHRLPTVIALHGALMTGRSMRRIFGLDDIAEHDRFAVVYPDGIRRRWNDGRTGDERGPDDVLFIRRLVDRLVRDGLADPERLYLVGVSNGGMMTFRMACEAPGVFAAYAAVIANISAVVADHCPQTVSAPFLIINSTNDRVVPWDGGDVGPGSRRGELLSTPDTVDFWRRRNGCNERAETKPLPDKDVNDGSTVRATQYADCRSNAPVVLLAVEGGGHLPPGAEIGDRPLLRLMMGPANQDISAADVSWKFFKRFPLPR